jgi:hypothetical protein
MFLGYGVRQKTIVISLALISDDQIGLPRRSIMKSARLTSDF